MPAAPRHFALRMWVFFFGYFIFGGVTLPFFPVWLATRGLSDVEIGLLIALPSLLRVFLTPLAGIYADHAPNRRFAVITLALPAVIVFLFAYPELGFWPLFVVIGIAFTLWGLALPPAEALALTGVGRFGIDYGRMRTGGSIAFIVANLGSGALLALLAPEWIFFFILFALSTTVAVAFALPVTPPDVRALDDATRPDTRPSRAVLGNRAFIALLVAVGLVQSSHAMQYGFGSIEWHTLGFSSFQIGLFWAFSIACEIALFTLAKPILRVLDAHGLLIIGAVAAIMRWTLFPVAPPGGFFAFALLQCLHGLSFGATYLGMQQTIARLVPERMTASAQGFLAMAIGLFTAICMSISGPIYGAVGIYGFWFMVPIASAGLVLLITLRRYARG